MAAAKEISLRRSTHSMDLMRDFSAMLAEEELLDVTLSCEDGSLSAHRIVLASSSHYFRTLFARLAASANKNQYPVIILKDIPFVDLKAIIEFIYRGEVVIPQSQLPSLVKSAEGLKIRGLDNDFENVPENNKKKKRKRRNRSSKESGSENESQSPSEVSTDEDDDHRTQITSVTDDRNSVSTVSDLEPSRLLEQTMTITGDGAENSHRFNPALQQSNVSSNDPGGLISQMESMSEPMTAQHAVALISFDSHHVPLPGPSSGHGQRQTHGEVRPFGAPAGLRSGDRLVNCVPLEMHHHPLHHLPLASSSSGSSQQAMSSRDDLLRRSRYPCPICLKQFSEKGNMKRHMTIHEQQRHRYICDLCSRCFSWKDNFNRHRRTHHV